MSQDMPWFKCNPAEWLQSCADMEGEEFGYYARLILFMYQRGGMAPFDEGKLRHIWNCSRQRARKVRDQLLEASRIERVGNHLTQSRVKRELRIAARIDEKLNENPAKTEQKVEKNPAKIDQVFSDNPLKTNDLKKQIQDTRGQRDTRERASPPNPESFKSAWNAWPKGQGRNCGEPEACRSWLSQLRDGADEADMLAAVKAYAKSAEPEYALRFDKFIRELVWREHVPNAPSDNRDGWESRLAAWARDGTWLRGWGPQPGNPACKAPADLIRQAQEQAA